MRRSLVALAMAVGLVTSQWGSALAVASPYSFTDPAGDAPKGQNTDVIKVTISHLDIVKFTIKMKNAVPFASWSTNGNLDGFQIPINGFNPYISAGKVSAALFNGESAVPGCPVSRSFNATKDQYAFSLARSCVGNPATIKVYVLALAHGSTRPSDLDRAPNTGFSVRVAKG
jgi:hypothetical protein